MAKILTWDIECSGVSFKANSGFLLCVGIKELGKPGVEMYQRDNIQPDPLDDKKLVKQVYDRLIQADMWVTHNGKWFDVKYMNSRLVKWGLPPLPNIPHFDTCEVVFKKLAIKGSLKEVGKYLHCKTLKHDVSMDEWVRAYAGDKKSLAEIVKHCVHDVKLTEQVYLKLRPLAFKHPNLSAIDENPTHCPVCNKKGSLIKRGFHFGAVNKSQRYQCKKCGAWSHGAFHKSGVEVRP